MKQMILCSISYLDDTFNNYNYSLENPKSI